MTGDNNAVGLRGSDNSKDEGLTPEQLDEVRRLAPDDPQLTPLVRRLLATLTDAVLSQSDEGERT